jgi:heat shock protein HslJ
VTGEGTRFTIRLVCWFTLAALLVSPATAASLAGSEWRPVEIAEVAIADDADIFVQFRAEGRITGHGGCNRFFGIYRLDGGRMHIGPLASTRKACPGPVMHRESGLLGALSRAKGFTRDRIDLTLRDASGNVIARFRQTDAD